MNRWLLVLVALAALGFGSLRGRDRWQASRTLSTVERISLQMIQSGKATVPALLANAKALERAERQDPANVAIILSRGSQYLLLNRPGSAIEIYEQALALEPRPEVYLNLGRAYWLLGRKGRAHRPCSPKRSGSTRSWPDRSPLPCGRAAQTPREVSTILTVRSSSARSRKRFQLAM